MIISKCGCAPPPCQRCCSSSGVNFLSWSLWAHLVRGRKFSPSVASCGRWGCGVLALPRLGMENLAIQTFFFRRPSPWNNPAVTQPSDFPPPMISCFDVCATAPSGFSNFHDSQSLSGFSRGQLIRLLSSIRGLLCMEKFKT
jgi:hypothetical protein